MLSSSAIELILTVEEGNITVNQTIMFAVHVPHVPFAVIFHFFYLLGIFCKTLVDDQWQLHVEARGVPPKNKI